MRGKPNLPAYWPNGLPGPDIEYGDNPVVVSTKATGYDKDKNYVLNSNIKLNITIPWIQGLSVSGNVAFDKVFNFRKLWQTPWYLYTWDLSILMTPRVTRYWKKVREGLMMHGWFQNSLWIHYLLQADIWAD